MKKIVLLAFIFIFLASFSVQLVVPKSAKAASGPCFFPAGAGGLVLTGGTCKEAGSGAYGINDVLSGRNSKGAGFAIHACVDSKQKFIDWIESRWYHTSTNCDTDLGDTVRDRIGAAFIIQEMRGKGNVWPTNADVAAWTARMQLADIGFARAPVTVGDTSYYDNDERNVFYGNHALVNRNVITITAGGITIAEVETECGNLVAGSRNLPDAKLSATAGADGNINVGQTFTFTASIDVTERVNVGAATFRYAIVNSGPNALPAGALRANTVVDIAGLNPRVNRPYTTAPINVPGRYCRTIIMNQKPVWGRYAPQSDQQCVNVVRQGAYRVTATTSDFEKGSGDATVTYTLFADTTPCGGANQVVTWGGTGVANRNVTVVACSAAGQKDQVVLTVPGNPTLNNAAVGPYGSYSATVTSPAGVPSFGPISINVYEVPYFRTYGNDISAAGCVDPRGIIADGRPNSGTLYGGITANTKGTLYAGAAAEYAAIALTGKVNSPVTGVFQNHSSAPIRLRAAWAAGNRVCPDTVYTKVSGADNLPGIVDLDLVAGATTSFAGSSPGTNTYIRGAGNVKLSGSLNASGKQTLYADGDVRITGNISAAKPAPFSNSTATVLLIIAKGNVYIDPLVSQVDAIIVAQNDIYTCSNDDFGGQSQNTVQGPCKNKLDINGALNARYIHFQRSVGTRLLAPDFEKSDALEAIGAAAETVNYPYYLYFATPYLADKAESSFQSYFSPAPYF